jgi:hypothetical protein
MFDSKIRALIDPFLARPGQLLAANGVGADVITVGGCALGIVAALAIAFGQFGIALTLLIANRIADGLDGAVARATQRTDFGAFLDITLDLRPPSVSEYSIRFTRSHEEQNRLCARC